MTTPRRRALVLTLALVAAGAVAPAPSAAAAAGCAPLPATVQQRSTGGTDLLTRFPAEARDAARFGFTTDLGAAFTAGTSTAGGLVPIERWYQPATHDFAWVPAGRGATLGRGYVRQKVDFHAATSADAAGCRVPVTGWTKAGRHRYSASTATANALVRAGWVRGGVVFWAGRAPTAPPAVDTTFTVAVIPDSQDEVSGRTNAAFLDRARWLAAQRAALDLRFVVHTGDVVSWDTPDHAQFAKARDGFAMLTRAGVPWLASIGNHDTAAVCPGGSACFGRVAGAPTAAVGLRDTRVFNAYLGGTAVSGRFEAGRVDNSYRLWSAGGVQWMTLNLELWPRAAVVAWAKKVLDANPRANVIVSTHMFLDGAGRVSTSAGGYGATSPRYLWDQALKSAPNVRVILSGHVGVEAASVLTNAAGRPVIALNGTWHQSVPVTRLLTIDTATGRITTRWYRSGARLRPDLDRTYTVPLVR